MAQRNGNLAQGVSFGTREGASALTKAARWYVALRTSEAMVGTMADPHTGTLPCPTCGESFYVVGGSNVDHVHGKATDTRYVGGAFALVCVGCNAARGELQRLGGDYLGQPRYADDVMRAAAGVIAVSGEVAKAIRAGYATSPTNSGHRAWSQEAKSYALAFTKYRA